MPRRGKILRFPGGPSGRSGRQPGADDDSGLVEVHRCDPAEALVVRSLFESEGIPTALRSRLASSVYPFSVGDQGEVTVLVPAPEVLRSRLLLARVAGGP